SIVKSFNSMLDNLQKLIGEVKNTTQEVTVSTDGMLQVTKRASHISREVVHTYICYLSCLLLLVSSNHLETYSCIRDSND
ncbi:hypothetical protein FC688_03285, partial [Bacillus cereus]